MRKTGIFVAIVGALCVVGIADAGIVSSTPQTGVIAPPPNANFDGALVSDTFVWAWEERSRYLGAAVAADYDGTVAGAGVFTGASAGPVLIAAGQYVASHMLMWDPTVGVNPAVGTGTITFDLPIIGIIQDDNLLDASDGVLGAAGTSYPTGVVDRGLEPIETWSVSADGLTFSYQFNAIIPGDTIRIITQSEPVPEPGALLLFGVGACAVGAWQGVRRRRKKGKA